MHLSRFFDSVRADPFGGRLTQGQVDGMNAILAGWREFLPGSDRRFLAYMLATAFHETARTMRPVRETLAESDAEAVARLEAAFAAGRLATVKTPYWRPDGEGKCWFGRGLVQITHRDNYVRLGRAVGVDLAADPGRALDMGVSVRVLLFGMTRGLFTGRRLDEFFTRDRCDWTGARATVNGLDRAERVAGHARAFFRALG